MNELQEGGEHCCHRDEPWHAGRPCYAAFNKGCSQKEAHQLRQRVWTAAVIAQRVFTDLIRVWGTPTLDEGRILADVEVLPREMPDDAADRAWNAARAIRTHANAYSAAGYMLGAARDEDGTHRSSLCVAAASILECVPRVDRDWYDARNGAYRVVRDLCEKASAYPLDAFVAQCCALVTAEVTPADALDAAQAVVA